LEKIITKTNPFSNSRVDTPFQNHIDLKEIFHNEFESLTSVLGDIKNDVENHQSKGAIVTGEPGTGKTHLMMRLAKARLVHNRLLFIRQPNNLNSVLYHIYSRVLESFVEKVPNSPYSQLEHLLATSFSKIIHDTFLEARKKKTTGIFDYFRKLTDKDRYLLKELSVDPLNIYKKLGEDGARNKREYWQRIEIIIDGWWKRCYGDVGYSTAILKGIVKFCSYSDVNKKKLVGKWLAANELEEPELKSVGLKNWKEEGSKEAFSLDAITVFGKLSMMDEPLIIIFDQLEALGLEYNQNLLQSFGDSVKELFTYVPNSLIILNLFPDRWEHFKDFFDGSVIGRVSQCQIVLNKPSQEELEKILVIKAQAQGFDVKKLLTQDDLQDILNQGSIREVLNRASHYYRFRTQDIPLPSIHRVKSFEDEVKEQLKGIKERINVSPANENISSSFEEEVREGFKVTLNEIGVLRQIVALALKQNVDVNNSTPFMPSIPVDLKTLSSVQTAPQSVSQQIMDYLEKERALLEEEYEKLVIISDSDDIGKLLNVAEAFNMLLNNIEVSYLKVGNRKLPEHVLIKAPTQSVVVGFLQVSDMVFPARIKNFNGLMFNRKDLHFTLFRDVRETTITGKVGVDEIEKLNEAPNGQFIYMDKENRITFELIYKLIVDIQNKDFDVDLEHALATLESIMNDYWLIQIFKKPIFS
jgi:Cdc6-like AAA superfamily ATPase